MVIAKSKLKFLTSVLSPAMCCANVRRTEPGDYSVCVDRMLLQLTVIGPTAFVALFCVCFYSFYVWLPSVDKIKLIISSILVLVSDLT